jgi:hypothetical protein
MRAGQGTGSLPPPAALLTGRGADIIVIDDPLKPDEAILDAQHKAANEWYDCILYSRLNDPISRARRLSM